MFDINSKNLILFSMHYSNYLLSKVSRRFRRNVCTKFFLSIIDNNEKRFQTKACQRICWRLRLIQNNESNSEFKKRLKCEQNIRFQNRSKYDDYIDINFVMRNTLIYHKKRQRLCIFKSLDKYIFELIHDKN